MNRYRLCLISRELITLVKKHQDEVLNAKKIINGIEIVAASEKEAREKANTIYPLMASQNIQSSAQIPKFPEINDSKHNKAWLDKDLTSCEILSD